MSAFLEKSRFLGKYNTVFGSSSVRSSALKKVVTYEKN